VVTRPPVRWSAETARQVALICSLRLNGG
jgi:hypothetical protein